jgi:hypothetical protein
VQTEKRTIGAWLVLVVVYAIRYWFVTLVLIGLIISAVTKFESEDPRPGYVDSGETLTTSECDDLGGEVVGDVCYTP